MRWSYVGLLTSLQWLEIRTDILGSSVAVKWRVDSKKAAHSMKQVHKAQTKNIRSSYFNTTVEMKSQFPKR